LARELHRFKDRRPVILGLARGGVPVGYEIAIALHAPLDAVLVRKIGVPWQRELALGAIVDGAMPDRFIDEGMVRLLSIPEAYIKEEVARQSREIERRGKLYSKGRPPVEVRDRTAIVVDDGIATGASMQVALSAIRRRGPRHMVLAVPVAAPDSLARLRPFVDECVCLDAPVDLGAIGMFYDDFHNVEDEEVIALLDQANNALTRKSG
jgi:putative phosphoribosyl transferase